jgi:hypothetical protein
MSSRAEAPASPVMYDTCLHCHRRFARNAAIEAFPVGRGLAFDEARGRLWVICDTCARWNLVPMDRRWEAIEGCARAFADTRRRVSTGEVALARLADGTRLVRIGAPRLPEYAAWRYGDRMAARRRAAISRGLLLGATAAGGVALAIPALAAAGGIAALVGAIGFGAFQTLVVGGALAASGGAAGLAARPVPVQDAAGRWVVPLKNTGYRFVADETQPDGWGIRLQGFGFTDVPMSYLEMALRNTGLQNGTPVTIGGAQANAALVRLLPRVNASGAPGRRVETAVRAIEEAGQPHDFLPHLARNLRPYVMRQAFGDSGDITALPPEIRLAMEMAVHDDLERAALEGELHRLEAAWRDAEAIAAIADRLLTPPAVDAKLDALRRRVSGG